MRRRLNVRNAMSVRERISRKNFCGKEHVVISGAGHMIEDSVMNGIFYPRDEVQALANALSGDIQVHSPASHPEYEGKFVSASHPYAIMSNWIGAFAYNFRMQGDRLVSDIAIEPETAAKNTQGKEILLRIESGEPLDMSTGLFLDVDMQNGCAPDGEEYQGIARNMELDHTALLPLETGAKQSNEGVGLFANAGLSKSGHDIDVDSVDLDATVNAIAAARNLPLAESGHSWDGAAATRRIRDYTNSTDAPSTNYRRYFAYFDSEKTEEFGSYKLPFADIIDGRPYAVPAALSAIQGGLSGARGTGVDIPEESKAAAQRLVDHYKSKMDKSEASNNADENFISWLKVKLFGNKEKSEYNVNELQTNANTGDDPMREKILAALNAAGVKAEGLDDDAMLVAYNKLQQPAEESKGGQDVAEVIANALKPVTDELAAVKAQLAANADKEVNEKAVKVAEIMGIDIEDAKKMSVNALDTVIAKSGQIAVNGSGFYGSKPGNALFDMQLPE